MFKDIQEKYRLKNCCFGQYILLSMKRTLACVNANVIQNGIRLKKSGMSPLGYFLCLEADRRARQISIVRPHWLFCPSGYFASSGYLPSPDIFFQLPD